MLANANATLSGYCSFAGYVTTYTIVLQVCAFGAVVHHNVPDIYLQRMWSYPGRLRVKFAVTVVNQQDPNNSMELGEASKSLRCFVCL